MERRKSRRGQAVRHRFVLGSPDFNFRSLRGNAVMRRDRSGSGYRMILRCGGLAVKENVLSNPAAVTPDDRVAYLEERIPGSMSFSPDPPESRDEYLARVDASLSILPERDRREILDEIRSHILERYATLPEPDAAIAICGDLGSPEAYAAAFLAEYGVAEPCSRAHAGRRRRVLLVAGGAAFAAVSLSLVVFGLLNILTPPAVGASWFRWRDLGFGDHGWLLLLIVSWALAAVAGIGAVTLLRRALQRVD